MYHFYCVTFTNNLNKEQHFDVIGSEEQVNDFCIKKANGRAYNYQKIATDRYSSTTLIYNLTNK